MNKKILLLIFIIVIVFFIGYLISQRLNKPQEAIKPPDLIEDFPSAPQFSSFPDSVFSFYGSPPQLPAKLPVFSYTYSSFSEDHVFRFAESANMSPVLKEIAPGIFDFRGEDFVLTLNKPNNALYFSWYGSFINNSKSPFQSIDQVLSLLKNAGIFMHLQTKEIAASPPPDAEGDIDIKSKLNRKEFHFILEGNYPFIFDPINNSSMAFEFIESKGIVSFLMRIPPVSITRKEDRAVITHQQILNFLSEKKGGLYAVADLDKPVEYEVDPVFRHVSIESVEIIYLPSKTEGILLPCFKISGIGKGSKNQRVEFFMRATQ